MYHLYTTPLPHTAHAPGTRTAHSFFMSDSLREDLQKRNEDTLYMADPSNVEHQKLPMEVNVYHSLFPLESSKEAPSKAFGCKTTSYRAINSTDGKSYLLRRVEGMLCVSFD